jgi:fructose-1,6-bisphosphatase I
MATNTNGEPGAAVQEAINTEIITLTRFLTEEQSKHKEATGDFTYVTVGSIDLLALM